MLNPSDVLAAHADSEGSARGAPDAHGGEVLARAAAQERARSCALSSACWIDLMRCRALRFRSSRKRRRSCDICSRRARIAVSPLAAIWVRLPVLITHACLASSFLDNRADSLLISNCVIYQAGLTRTIASATCCASCDWCRASSASQINQRTSVSLTRVPTCAHAFTRSCCEQSC